MAYYKIIKDGIVIDALDDGVFVRRNPRGMIVSCGPDRAIGVVSSDSSLIYHIDGAAPLGDYPDVIVADITAEEYAELKAQLDLGEDIPAEPDVPEDSTEDTGTTEPEPEAENVMTPAQMRQRIMEQEQQITMLTDCLLEMSEVVYGG